MPNKKYPLHGRFIDDQSIDEKTKLIRYPNVKVLPENWELVNFASLDFLQNEQTIFIFNRIGVKIINSNVALTSLNTFPNYVGYIPQNKERVLLIAQTDPLQNGFYEWQIVGNLVRLYDWRDVIAGNGLTINDNTIAIKLLEYLLVPARNDNFLQFDVNGKLFARIASDAVGLKINANRELYIDSAELGGGGSGVSTLDVPHPDIHSVGGDDILLPNDNAPFQIIGGNFRRDASVLCEGFTILEFYNRRSNLISMNVQATNLIGIHDVLVKHLTLDSGDSGKQKFTVLGSAIIDTVSPKAKRGFTTVLTVTGVGFALISSFVTNIVGVSIALLTVTDRFLVTIEVTVDNSVNSGLYNLICNNVFAGFLYDSGSSGNNKLEIFGDPIITTVFGIGGFVFAEIPLGTIGAEFTCNGFDLTNDISVLPNGFTINNVSGVITQKIVNFDASSDKNLIGLKNIYCEDNVNGGNSGTTGNNKIALNFPTNATIRRAGAWRAYGGGVLSDWSFVGNSIEKIGGSGDCFLEMDDIFLNPAYLNNLFGVGGDDFMTFFIRSLNGSFVGDVYIMLGDKGANLTVADFNNTNVVSAGFKVTFDGAGGFAINYRTFQITNGIQGQDIDYRFRLRDVGSNLVFTIFETAFGAAMPNSTSNFGVFGHVAKTLHICMTNNFMVNDIYLQGRVGD